MSKSIAICPTVERLDLVRQLTESYRSTWRQDLILHPPMTVDFSSALPLPKPVPDWNPTEDEVNTSLPAITFAVSGNDDATEGWLKNQAEQGLPYHVVRFPEITPYAKAVNAAAKVALERDKAAEWLLLLNNDLILQPGFWAAFNQMVDCGYEIFAAKLLYPNGTIQHYGKWFTLDFYPFHVLRHQPADNPFTLQVRPFPDVTFACVAIKRAIWDDLNGLDENYVNGYEDDDFCLRARERGAQIGVHPGMLATHLEAQSTGIDTANKAVQYERFHREWIDNGRISWPLGIHQGWRQG